MPLAASRAEDRAALAPNASRMDLIGVSLFLVSSELQVYCDRLRLQASMIWSALSPSSLQAAAVAPNDVNTGGM